MIAPVVTERLTLIPCPEDVAREVARNRGQVEWIMAVQIPAEWPDEDLADFLLHYAGQLERDPLLLGWGVWLMVHTREKLLIGDLGFKGRPNEEGAVEIGFNVLPAHRNRGYGFEATRALIEWATAHPAVRLVVAETRPDNSPSIRVLEKLDFHRLGEAGGLLQWQLKVA